jgi:hypothetical protein
MAIGTGLVKPAAMARDRKDALRIRYPVNALHRPRGVTHRPETLSKALTSQHWRRARIRTGVASATVRP